MNKEELIHELTHSTYVKLAPSSVAGIGVFAITHISKGETNIFSKDESDWISIKREEVNSLPLHSKELVENFCLYDENNYFVPSYGFKMIDLVVFLNHSETPNITSVNEGEYFIALKDIERGEELFIDYGSVV